MQQEVGRYGLSTGVIPSLGAVNREGNLRRYIIFPGDRYYRIWKAVMVTLGVYSVWVSCFELGFLKKPPAVVSIIDNVINGIFFVDVILRLFVAYKDKTTYLLVDNPREIFWKKKWMLILETLSSIPVEVGMIFHSHRGYRTTYIMFNIFRCYRVVRIFRFLSRLEKNTNLNYTLVRYMKLIFVALSSVHAAGCLYYLIAESYFDPDRTWIGKTMESFLREYLWKRYVTTVYWAITTLTSVGFGDIHPVNEWEMLFVACYMLFDIALLYYISGSIGAIIFHELCRTKLLRDAIEAILSFSGRNQLPTRLKDQMLAHLDLKFRTDSEALQQQVVDSFPKAIRTSISQYLFHSLVDNIYLFRGISSDLLFQSVSEMRAEYFPPQADIILENETPSDLYILVTGSVDLLVLKNGVEQVVGRGIAGELFGDIGFLCCKPQLFTVRTNQLSQLLRLDSTAFWDIVRAKAGEATKITHNLLEHLKEDPALEGIFNETEKKLARGGMDLPVDLCFVAGKGTYFFLRKLLKRGQDPDESDKMGRTALHIVAAKGDVDRVKLLLDFGANPNIRDSDGNVPLWLAMFHEHASGEHARVTTLLAENGATLDRGDVGAYACRAVELNNLYLLDRIIRFKGNISVQTDNTGTTALHAAVFQDNAQMVEFLLGHGAKIDQEDQNGCSPRELALQRGHQKIIGILSDAAC